MHRADKPTASRAKKQAITSFSKSLLKLQHPTVHWFHNKPRSPYTFLSPSICFAGAHFICARLIRIQKSTGIWKRPKPSEWRVPFCASKVEAPKYLQCKTDASPFAFSQLQVFFAELTVMPRARINLIIGIRLLFFVVMRLKYTVPRLELESSSMGYFRSFLEF